jgi:hypothetical protein
MEKTVFSNAIYYQRTAPLSYMLFLGIDSNLILYFVTQALQDPPLGTALFFF